MLRLFRYVFLVMTLGLVAGRAVGADDAADTDGPPVLLRAGTVRAWTDRQTRYFLAEGGVTLSRDGRHLKADKAVVWFYPLLSKFRHQVVLDVYAVGNVELYDGTVEVPLERAYVRWERGRVLRVEDDDMVITQLDAAPMEELVGQAFAHARRETPLDAWETGGTEPIEIEATEIRSWTEGDLDIFGLQGKVKLKRGEVTVEARRAIVWLDREKSRITRSAHVEVFAEGDVKVIRPESTQTQEAEFFTWRTTSPKGVLFNDYDGIIPQYPRAQYPKFFRIARRVRVLQSAVPAVERRKSVKLVGDVQESFRYVPVEGQKSVFDRQRGVQTVTGGVHVETDAFTLRCDNLVAWPRPGQLAPRYVYAEGRDLTLTFPDDSLDELMGGEKAPAEAGRTLGYRTLKASEMFIDLQTKEFIVVQGTLRQIQKVSDVPIVFHAETIRQRLVRPEDVPGEQRVTVYVDPDNRDVAYNHPGLVEGRARPLERLETTRDRIRGWHKPADPVLMDPNDMRPGDAEVLRTELRPQKGVIVADRAWVTTCEFGVPHYRYNTSRIVLEDLTREQRDLSLTERRTRRALVYDGVFQAGAVPLTYWPKLRWDLDWRVPALRELRFKSSSDKGFQTYTTWDLYDLGLYENDWSNLYLHVDPMTARGVGLGLDFFYEKNDHEGWIRSYYINDKRTFDDAERDIYRILRSERGRVRLMDRWSLGKNTRLDTEFNYLSDRHFLQEFFEEEFKSEKVTENIVYLHHLDGISGLTAEYKWSVADFVETVEYMPRIQYFRVGDSFWHDRLVYSSQVQLANLRGRPDPMAPFTFVESGRTWRLHSNHEVSHPMRFDEVKFTPWLGVGLTSYEKGAREQSLARLAGSMGFRAGTEYWKVYPVESRLLDLKDIRHIVTPTLDWTYVYGVGHSRDDVYQLDAIDETDEVQFWTLGLRQRFQTKRRVKSIPRAWEAGDSGEFDKVDWVILDLRTRYYPSDDRDNGGQHFGPLEYDVQTRLSERVTVRADGYFDFENDQELDVANVGFTLNHSPRLTSYIGNRFIRELDSSTLIYSLDYVIDPRWAVTTAFQYDHRAGESISTRASLKRSLDRWVLEVGFEYDPGERDTTVTLTISPRDIPKTEIQFF